MLLLLLLMETGPRLAGRPSAMHTLTSMHAYVGGIYLEFFRAVTDFAWPACGLPA